LHEKRPTSCEEAAYFLAGMQHIIGMPGHIIMLGMPMFIMAIMRSQQSLITSIDMPSIGFMVQTIPAGVISHVIWHIIIGIDMPIMPPIIGIGMPIMFPIIGIIPGIIPGIIGIMLPIWFTGICMAGIIFLAVLSALTLNAVSITLESSRSTAQSSLPSVVTHIEGFKAERSCRKISNPIERTAS
jgi:hypothetical protein